MIPWETGRTGAAHRAGRRWGAVLVVTGALVLAGCGGAASATRSTHPTTTTTTEPPAKRIPPGLPSDQRTLSVTDTISGPISPKSVASSSTGLVFAQNMMYRHSVTVYNSAGTLVKTIPDSVTLSDFGIAGRPGVTQGAPVEAAFTPDARYAYVSNYSMYGSGSGPEGSDSCTPQSAAAAGDTPSFIYRIDLKTLAVDQVIQVGLVPKVVAVTPDGKYLLVSNWCSWTLSVVDIATAKEVKEIPIGPYPRGIVVSPDSKTAYVAEMGASALHVIDLASLTDVAQIDVGRGPRALVMDPAGHYLYATLNQAGEVVRVDLGTNQVVGRVTVGAEPRSLAIATDGLTLYVVDYDDDNVKALRSADLSTLQTVPTGVHPIGVTYDDTTGNVWVAVYTGDILVLSGASPP